MNAMARMGILVGGGSAPGINSAISAAVVEVVNSGLSVVGIVDGYKHLADGRTDMAGLWRCNREVSQPGA